MILRGRRKIVSEFTSTDLLDVNNVIKLLNTSYITHTVNREEIVYLMNYHKGSQAVLAKEKTVRPEINNKVVINHAQMVTRMVNGYFLGTPIQYIQAGDSDKKTQIDELNRYVQYEDKASVDKEIGEYQSICGTAYRIIYTDGLFADETPFEEKALSPANTYVVYENNIAERPLVGVTYYTILDEHGFIDQYKIYAYTEFGVYEFHADDSGKITETDTVAFTPYSIGGIPIIEYPNNMWRMGDWELCIDLMDAINALQSGRLDDIDQTVQSLIIFINADIDSDRYQEMRESGVVMLTNNTGAGTDAKNLNNALDHTGMNAFAEELETLLYAILGIPDRNSRSGGGDTGQAVELRDGWADLEIVARNKELTFKKSEKQTLRILLNILNNTLGMDLSLMDIDIKFTRNKNNNLLVKTQGYMNLLQTKTLSPQDCLTIVDLVSDVNEYISRGKTFWGESFAGLEQSNVAVESSKVALENVKNPPEESASGTSGKNTYNDSKSKLAGEAKKDGGANE